MNYRPCLFCTKEIRIDYDTYDNIDITCINCEVCITYDGDSFDVLTVVYFINGVGYNIRVHPFSNQTSIHYLSSNTYTLFTPALLLPPDQLKEKIKLYLAFL